MSIELTKESKIMIDMEFEIIHSIAKRIEHNRHNPSDDYIKHSAIAIYLKIRDKLTLNEEDD